MKENQMLFKKTVLKTKTPSATFFGSLHKFLFGSEKGRERLTDAAHTPSRRLVNENVSFGRRVLINFICPALIVGFVLPASLAFVLSPTEVGANLTINCKGLGWDAQKCELFNNADPKTRGEMIKKAADETPGGLTKYFIDGLNWFTSNIAVLVITLLSFLVTLAGSLFDYTIKITILELSTTIGYMTEGITIAWTALRDIANMFFILILLYISIATILQLSNVNVNRMLKNVIVIALLINFSMFFTQVIIDFSNAFAVAFYGAVASEAGGPAGEVNIAKSFMDKTQLINTWFDEGNSAHILRAAAGGEFTSLITLVFVLGIFLVTLAFAFLAGAFFLIVRFIMFVILIILSPLAFISVIIPQTSGMFQRWFSSLTNHAIFAPVFMALIWISLILVSSIKVMPDFPANASLATVVASTDGGEGVGFSPNTPQIIFQIIIAIGFLYASLIIAKSLGIQGGAWAGRTGKGLTRKALFVGGAVTGYALTRTIGKAAREKADDEKLKRKAGKSRWASMQLAASERLARSGFGSAATINKGGYTAKQEREKQKYKARTDRQKTSDVEKDGAIRELREAEASGNATRIATAQKRRDEVFGVSEAEARKRQKQALETARSKVLANLSATGTTLDQVEFNKQVEAERLNEIAAMNAKGMATVQTLSEEAQRISNYVNSIQDGYFGGRAHIRQHLRDLDKEKK